MGSEKTTSELSLEERQAVWARPTKRACCGSFTSAARCTLSNIRVWEYSASGISRGPDGRHLETQFRPPIWIGRKSFKHNKCGAWRSPVAHLLWEPLSGVGERRPASEILGFCVSCVGERWWVTTQFLAQFKIAYATHRTSRAGCPGFILSHPRKTERSPRLLMLASP